MKHDKFVAFVQTIEGSVWKQEADIKTSKNKIKNHSSEPLVYAIYFLLNGRRVRETVDPRKEKAGKFFFFFFIFKMVRGRDWSRDPWEEKDF